MLESYKNNKAGTAEYIIILLCLFAIILLL